VLKESLGKPTAGMKTQQGTRFDKVLKAARTLDCRGLLCPMPIIKIAQAIREIQIGQILELFADAPNSQADIEA